MYNISVSKDNSYDWSPTTYTKLPKEMLAESLLGYCCTIAKRPLCDSHNPLLFPTTLRPVGGSQ